MDQKSFSQRGKTQSKQDRTRVGGEKMDGTSTLIDSRVIKDSFLETRCVVPTPARESKHESPDSYKNGVAVPDKNMGNIR